MRIRKKTYPRLYDEIFEASLSTVKKLGWKVTSQNREKGEIKAKTGTTLRSWGENVTIDVTQETTGSTISVMSNAHSQLFDWGKDEKNEECFYKELQKIIER